MRAILIDPFEKTVKEIDMLIGKDKSSLKAMYNTLDCDTVDVITFWNFDLWIDDEGVFVIDNAKFLIHNDSMEYTFNIFGKALCLSRGGNDDSETVDLDKSVTVDDIIKIVRFQ